MQLGGHGGEIGVIAGRALELEQGARGVGVAVDERAGEEVCDEPDPVGGTQAHRARLEQGEQAQPVEAPGHGVVGAGPSVGVLEQAAGGGEPARQGPGQQGAEPLRDEVVR